MDERGPISGSGSRLGGLLAWWRDLVVARPVIQQIQATRAVTWFLFIAAVAGCYAFYAPFDAWWYLVSPSSVSGADGADEHRVDRRLDAADGQAGGIAAALVVALLAWRGVDFAGDHWTFQLQDGERKYVAVGNYIGVQLPDRAAIICVQHSGGIRYYSGRLTVHDWITSAASIPSSATRLSVPSMHLPRRSGHVSAALPGAQQLRRWIGPGRSGGLTRISKSMIQSRQAVGHGHQLLTDMID